MAHEKHIGPVPSGYEVDHLCRNERCVNPDHLEAVTKTENVRRSRATKLSAADVRTIRFSADLEAERARRAGKARRRLGWQIEMAERFGCTVDNIKQIVRGVSWRAA